MHNECFYINVYRMQLDSCFVDDDGSFYLMNNFFVQIFFVVIFPFYSYYITISFIYFSLFSFCFLFFFVLSHYARFRITFYFLFCYDKNWNKYIKVVQEYERAVIFRLGRLMQGGAKGPGE